MHLLCADNWLMGGGSRWLGNCHVCRRTRRTLIADQVAEIMREQQEEERRRRRRERHARRREEDELILRFFERLRTVNFEEAPAENRRSRSPMAR